VKDQYFGDQTDFIKYGILQAFALSDHIDLYVHWAKTPNDESSDGSRTRYLAKPELWRHFNPSVFDFIRNELTANRRSLRAVEQNGILPRTAFCFDEWSRQPQRRVDSLADFLAAASRPGLVFLDPDNGLSTPNVAPFSPAARKYVFPGELQYVWEGGHSLAIYQHYPRVQRLPYLTNQMNRIATLIGPYVGAVINTSHVAFLFCFQADHAEEGVRIACEAGAHWIPHTRTYVRRDDGSLEPVVAEVRVSGFEQAELPL
jgi:hypothetical protein